MVSLAMSDLLRGSNKNSLRHRWFLWFCNITITIFSIFLAIVVFAQCTPTESIWNPVLADQRVCNISLTVVAISYCCEFPLLVICYHY